MSGCSGNLIGSGELGSLSVEDVQLQGTLEFCVELDKFYNVDLFLRGYYQLKIDFRLKHCSSTSSSGNGKYPYYKIEQISSSSTAKNKNSTLKSSAQTPIPGSSKASNAPVTTPQFRVLFRNEEVDISQIVLFRLQLYTTNVEDLVDLNRSLEYLLELTLIFNDVTVSVRTLNLFPTPLINYNRPIFFDYFHLCAVSLSVHGGLIAIQLINAGGGSGDGGSRKKSNESGGGIAISPSMHFIDCSGPQGSTSKTRSSTSSTSNDSSNSASNSTLTRTAGYGSYSLSSSGGSSGDESASSGDYYYNKESSSDEDEEEEAAELGTLNSLSLHTDSSTSGVFFSTSSHSTCESSSGGSKLKRSSSSSRKLSKNHSISSNSSRKKAKSKRRKSSSTSAMNQMDDATDETRSTKSSSKKSCSGSKKSRKMPAKSKARKRREKLRLVSGVLKAVNTKLKLNLRHFLQIIEGEDVGGPKAEAQPTPNANSGSKKERRKSSSNKEEHMCDCGVGKGGKASNSSEDSARRSNSRDEDDEEVFTAPHPPHSRKRSSSEWRSISAWTRINAENILMWHRFLDSIVGNDRVRRFLRMRHHLARTKRFAEGFYVTTHRTDLFASHLIPVDDPPPPRPNHLLHSFTGGSRKSNKKGPPPPPPNLSKLVISKGSYFSQIYQFLIANYSSALESPDSLSDLHYYLNLQGAPSSSSPDFPQFSSQAHLSILVNLVQSIYQVKDVQLASGATGLGTQPNFNTHQLISMLKKSIIYELLPISCAELDGDANSVPIIFEERFVNCANLQNSKIKTDGIEILIPSVKKPAPKSNFTATPGAERLQNYSCCCTPPTEASGNLPLLPTLTLPPVPSKKSNHFSNPVFSAHFKEDFIHQNLQAKALQESSSVSNSALPSIQLNERALNVGRDIQQKELIEPNLKQQRNRSKSLDLTLDENERVSGDRKGSINNLLNSPDSIGEENEEIIMILKEAEERNRGFYLFEPGVTSKRNILPTPMNHAATLPCRGVNARSKKGDTMTGGSKLLPVLPLSTQVPANTNSLEGRRKSQPQTYQQRGFTSTSDLEFSSLALHQGGPPPPPPKKTAALAAYHKHQQEFSLRLSRSTPHLMNDFQKLTLSQETDITSPADADDPMSERCLSGPKPQRSPGEIIQPPAEFNDGQIVPPPPPPVGFRDGDGGGLSSEDISINIKMLPAQRKGSIGANTTEKESKDGKSHQHEGKGLYKKSQYVCSCYNINAKSQDNQRRPSSEMILNPESSSAKSSELPPLFSGNPANVSLPFFEFADELRVFHPAGLHLIICVHGLDGSSHDLRLFRVYLELSLPSHNLHFLMSEKNQDGVTFSSFRTMTDKFISEVTSYISENGLGPQLKRVSFVGHSLGNIIIRSALSRPEFAFLLPKLHTFLSLSGPHLGTLYNQSGIVNVGMWLMQKWKKSTSLLELSLKDHPDIRQTFLYQLTENSNLHRFKYVLLCGSSTQDRYVPIHSAHIAHSKLSLKDKHSTIGVAYREMVSNLINPILKHSNLVRFDVHHTGIGTHSANSFIGRAAHIAVLDSEIFIEKFLSNTIHYFI